MRSRVSVFCDQVLEAGWLLALIIVPLYFNVYSSRVFEPDKITLLRSIVLVMVLAWLIKTLGEGVWSLKILPSAGGFGDAPQSRGNLLSRLIRVPLLLPTLLLVSAYLVATIFSVTPRVSFWGSYQRLQGAFSTLSYIVVFFMVLLNLRRPEQLHRLLFAVVLTSLPIAFYGILQHYGLDPLPWGGNVVARVASNMGNAIFISAYLIMVLPLTLARMVHAFPRALDQQPKQAKIGLVAFYVVSLLLQLWAWGALGVGRGLLVSGLLLVALLLVALYLRQSMARFLLLGCLGFILSLQLVCILFSQSRGPLLGLGGALFFFALLYVFIRRWRRTAVGLTGLMGLALAFLVLINLPQSPLSAVHRVPYIGQLGRVFEVSSGTGKVRVLIWEGALDMLQANPLRTLIGYGPESMYVAYNPYYPPDLAHYEARNASPDRSHNETFDALITTGVLGLLAYFFLFGSIFYYGLSWLGLIRGPRSRRAFALAGISGGVVGIALAYPFDGSLRFAGVALPIGFLAGVAALRARLRPGHSAWAPCPSRRERRDHATPPARCRRGAARRSALERHRPFYRDPLWHRHRGHQDLLLGLCRIVRGAGAGLGVIGRASTRGGLCFETLGRRGPRAQPYRAPAALSQGFPRAPQPGGSAVKAAASPRRSATDRVSNPRWGRWPSWPV